MKYGLNIHLPLTAFAETIRHFLSLNETDIQLIGNLFSCRVLKRAIVSFSQSRFAGRIACVFIALRISVKVCYRLHSLRYFNKLLDTAGTGDAIMVWEQLTASQPTVQHLMLLKGFL